MQEIPIDIDNSDMKTTKISNAQTFAIQDIEASPIGGAMHISHNAQDFEEEYKNLFYNN